ncbi:MAG TPA: hypothetical protein VGD60_19375 [Candidatus Acidoferrales bacterium]
MPKLKTHFEQVPLQAVLHVVSLDELPYPQWQTPLRQAQLETKLEALQEKVFQAEAAIYARLQELSRSNNGYHERAAIMDGSNELLRIKTDKLKWPEP